MRNRPSPYRLEAELRRAAWRSAMQRIGRVLRAFDARLQTRRAAAELEVRSERELRDLGLVRCEIRKALRDARLRASRA
ncbi:MAG: DUF1127 domain-containing protein [Burkholderiaceae bacterium]|nr:DUF1127 domain-containing protein [Burkholderiaceae bacterium]